MAQDMEDPQNCTEISTNSISKTAKVQSISSLCEQQLKTYDIEKCQHQMSVPSLLPPSNAMTTA